MKDQGNINLQELSYEALQGGMLKADFEKSIKKNATWRNKKALIMLFNYKIANKGAKRAVAIPFKKIGDAKKLFKKEIKKDPNIKLKDVLIGMMDLDKEEDGRTVIKVQQIAGGASPAIIHKQGNELFELMGFEIQLLSKAEGKAEKIKKDDGNDEEALEAAELNESYSIITRVLSEKIGLLQLLELEKLANSFEQQIKEYYQANSQQDISRWTKLLKQVKALLQQKEANLSQLKGNMAKVNQEIERLNQLLRQAGYNTMPLADTNTSNDLPL